MTYNVQPIGKIFSSENGAFIKIEEEYIPAIKALEGFSHINVIWWFHKLDNDQARSVLQVEKPYKNAPNTMGVFATRSPMRPNPIALTAAQIIHIDETKGIIQIAFIDAADGTPVLDLKPYTPSFDRIENPGVPAWCSHWPKSSEESADFPWEQEFQY